MNMRLEINILKEGYALALLPSGSPMPSWVSGPFTAVISSAEGITVVCPEDNLPDGLKAQSGFRCLQIAGVFDLASVGVLASVAQPLAAAGISLFAYATWETDYVLIQEENLTPAISTLTEAGHAVRQR